jgi:MoaA/NifB/PqqE/SkfB family radical SAM enzyme
MGLIPDIGISLDGMETTHDLFGQQKGAFNAAIRGIELCLSKGIKSGHSLYPKP